MVKDYLSVLVVILTVLCLFLLWFRFLRRRKLDKYPEPLTDAQIKAAQEELAQYNFCFLKNDFHIWQVTKDLDKPIRTLQLRDTIKVEVVPVEPRRLRQVSEFYIDFEVGCLHCNKLYVPSQTPCVRELGITPLLANNYCSRACCNADSDRYSGKEVKKDGDAETIEVQGAESASTKKAGNEADV